MNIYKKALLFFPLPSPRPLPHRPHARPPRPFRHTAGEAGAPPPSHRRRAAGAHPSSPPHRAGPPRSLSSTAHSSSLPCSVPCAERRRGLAPSSSYLSHDGGVRIWLCSATRCHPPPPHPAPTRRIRAGGGSTRRERRPARAACAGAAARRARQTQGAGDRAREGGVCGPRERRLGGRGGASLPPPPISLSHDGDRIWLCSAARCHPPPPHPAPPRRMPPRCMWGPRPPPPAPAMLKDAEAGRAEQEAALCARDGEVARLMKQDPAPCRARAQWSGRVRARRRPEQGLRWRGASREGRGRRREAWRSLMAAETGRRARWKAREWGSLATSSAGEARELCRRAHVACEFHLGGGSRHGQPRGGKILPPPWSGEAGGRPRRPLTPGAAASAQSASSRGGGHELQGAVASAAAASSSGRRGGRGRR